MVRPGLEVTFGQIGLRAPVVPELQKDVPERRRWLHAPGNGEGQSVSLAGTEVGVLADDY